jgi:hypothetical protein
MAAVTVTVDIAALPENCVIDYALGYGPRTYDFRGEENSRATVELRGPIAEVAETCKAKGLVDVQVKALRFV